MAMFQNPMNEALRLRTELASLGVDEAEIAFPETNSQAGPGVICFVSETLDDSPELTPSLARRLRNALAPYAATLGGRSVRLEGNSCSLIWGDSGAFLIPWF